MLPRYLSLVKAAGRLTENANKLPIVRIAVLGDHATQQLCKVLRAVLHEAGWWAEIYEGEFDDIRAEILVPGSGMQKFEPDYVWLCFSSQQYRRRFYHTPPEELTALPSQWTAEVAGLAKAAGAHGRRVIISNLAPARERFFGNFAVQTLASLHSSITEANRQLAAAVREVHECLIADVSYVATCMGLDQWYDERLWTHAKYPCAPQNLEALASTAASIISATRGRIAKVVVLDLDNTLWGGVIGDDGLDKIEIGGLGAGEAFEEFQRYLLQLKHRGVILAVCSKNDEVNARQPFQEHTGMVLKESDISAFIANWEPKSENIRQISRLLNVGLDSMVFVDDSAFERNQVRAAIPEVRVPEIPEDPARYVAALEATGWFEATSFTEDDRRRGDMYREETERVRLRDTATSLEDYLASLQMQMVSRPFDSLHLQRVAQLLQRSNQFNLCTRRYSEGDCRGFMEDSGKFPTLRFSLRDKFGDYGLISAVCTEVVGARLHIREWAMSCRVLNRGVEHQIVTSLVRLAREKGLTAIEGEYIPTAKNGMVADLYPRLGFQSLEGNRWQVTLANFTETSTHIALDLAL